MERKYNAEFRKKLVSKLEKQRTKQEMKTVYNIISSYNFSLNSNEMFLTSMISQMTVFRAWLISHT